jgi:hypothetical protein
MEVDLAVTVSGPSLHTYLTNLGIGEVNTIYGGLHMGLASSVPLSWSIDVWPKLEVVRVAPGDALHLDWAQKALIHPSHTPALEAWKTAELCIHSETSMFTNT